MIFDVLGEPASASVIHKQAQAPNVGQDMVRKKPRTIRLSEEGDKRITELAAQADVDFSHMTRRMLAYASRYMPAGWVPPVTSSDRGPR